MLLLALFLAGESSGDVRLPRLVDDHMVLQRDTKILIWGWADPHEQVEVDFLGQKQSTLAGDDGKWDIPVGPFPSGGPFEMTVRGKNTLQLHDILVGDVWLASGQSNMEFPLKPGAAAWMTGVINADEEAASADYPLIRLCHVHKRISLRPVSEVEVDRWVEASPETVGGFSALAYLFGRELYRRHKVPIGLIEADWGGTVAEAWVSEESLKPFPEFKPTLDSLEGMDEKAALAEYEGYLKAKAAWYDQHGAEDRGRAGGRDLWAAPNFDDSGWPTIQEPQVKREDALKGFDRTVWFRRGVDVPENLSGIPLTLHLTASGKHDETYFNGEKVGETEGWDRPRTYRVPGQLVRPGRNVIAVRQAGTDGYVGFFGEPERLNLQAGDTTLSIAGKWAFQTGPDIAGLPAASALIGFRSDPNTPSVLFNGMIAPLAKYRIRGVIWYQGESNAVDKRTVQYRSLFQALIQDWRARWGYQVPFLFVQLAGFGPNKAEPADYPWAELREAQAMALTLPNTGMATAVDIGDEKDIHPRNKQDLAHRLALVAEKTVYGEKVVSSGPLYESSAVEGDRIRIRFSSLGSGWLVKDKYGYIRGFEIAAADGNFVWAKASQDGQDIVVSHESVLQPAAVRYDWSNTPDGNLYNKEGLPAVPFRTNAKSLPAQ